MVLVERAAAPIIATSTSSATTRIRIDPRRASRMLMIVRPRNRLADGIGELMEHSTAGTSLVQLSVLADRIIARVQRRRDGTTAVEIRIRKAALRDSDSAPPGRRSRA